jgi:hypothetical protein
MGFENKRIREGRSVEPALTDAIRARLKEGKLDCAAAFVLAKKMGISPLTAGEAADSLGVRLDLWQ